MPATPASASDTHVDLLWTGGWDSTFRLLQLLLLQRVPVVPHYLQDPTRPSTPVELQAMARIAAHLCARFPHVRELLRPLRIAHVDTLAIDPDIADALRDIRRRSYIGDQYAWLPMYCRRNGIHGIELGVHIDDKVQALVRPVAAEYAHPAGYRSVRVDPRWAGSSEHRLFGDFGFPLFGIDKVGIDRAADAAGWSEIMEMTWFCHTPVRGKPCGICAPCLYTIEEGLARRVPASRRVVSFFYRRLVLPFKAPLRRMRMSLRERRADRRAA
ncbi:hypothetical protein ACFPN1_11380 [Lysobacter yangpyeongensis]|uniref:7-cyano-7-deazaguanine synthase n=1 Tax=Lysobacter yangpyeongensis TaxID=346182 RepID=A0ABW0SNJ7_9GAMM